MKININQSELLTALTTVCKGVTQRPSLPILSGVYIEAKDNSLLFQTTDLEISIQYSCSCLVEEPGKTVLPAKLMTNIVKNLPDAAVRIETTNEAAAIACESSAFSLHVFKAQDFPGFPEVITNQQITIPFETLASVAKKVCRAVSKDESRIILTGICLSVEENTLKFIATDSYRLAVAQYPLQNPSEEFSVILPGSFVADIASLPPTGQDITFAIAKNQVVVTYENTKFVNRRIEGTYPNYKQLLPPGFNTRCMVKKADLIAAVKRASLLEAAGSQIHITVSAENQTIQLTTQQELGSTQETIPGQIEGQDIEIGFNSNYINEGLSTINSSEVVIELQDSLKPGILKGLEEDNYLYLVMPVRI